MSNRNGIIPFTCKRSANVIDWIRSIYFSLFGSAMLTFAIKFSAMSVDSGIYFGSGVFCFFAGLVSSSIIANRFKNYEKLYDTQSVEFRKNTSLLDFFIDEETKESESKEEGNKTKSKNRNLVTHIAFLTIWIPALFLIFIGGFMLETKSAESTLINVRKLDSINLKISVIESQHFLIDSLVKENSSLLYQTVKLKDQIEMMKEKELRDSFKVSSSSKEK